MIPWHENDALWEEIRPALTGEALLKAAADEARQAAALLRIQPGARVLDMGCGPGRHTIEMARLGYRVTGVDRTASYLEEARKRLVEAGVEAELVRDTMLTFRRGEAFDGAISLLSSFGYFEDLEDDLRALRNIHFSLRPGARVVLDVMGKEILARSFIPRHWQELEAGRFWMQEREVLPGWEKMRHHWIFAGGGPRVEFEFEHRIYCGADLARLMMEAGFTTEIYGGLDGSSYDRDATRLVAVGRKAG